MSGTSGQPVPAPATTPPTSDRGWWHRNRWGLVALPVALVLTLAASGDRVRTLWWEQDLRRPTTAAPGETVTYHQDVRDGVGGTYPVDVDVRLDRVEDAAVLPDRMELPAGTRAVQVDLTLSADPDTVLLMCRVAVRGADGTRYDYVPAAWGANQPALPCVPDGASGPWPPGATAPTDIGDPRPGSWSVSPVLVVPEDVEVAEVVLWWDLPHHVRLEVGR